MLLNPFVHNAYRNKKAVEDGLGPGHYQPPLQECPHAEVLPMYGNKENGMSQSILFAYNAVEQHMKSAHMAEGLTVCLYDRFVVYARLGRH